MESIEPAERTVPMHQESIITEGLAQTNATSFSSSHLVKL